MTKEQTRAKCVVDILIVKGIKPMSAREIQKPSSSEGREGAGTDVPSSGGGCGSLEN